MTQWVRHTSQTVTNPGGFWGGSHTDAVIVDNCSTAQQTTITAAHTALKARPGINAFPLLKAHMLKVEGGMRIDCCFDASRPPRGDTPDGNIFVCGETGPALEALVCKGLVETQFASSDPLATLLDVKAMQFSCLGAPLGAPTAGELGMMAGLPIFGGNAAEREGTFVIWNRTTGQVWDKTPATGGFWGGTTPSAKAALAFTNAAWVF